MYPKFPITILQPYADNSTSGTAQQQLFQPTPKTVLSDNREVLRNNSQSSTTNAGPTTTSNGIPRGVTNGTPPIPGMPRLADSTSGSTHQIVSRPDAPSPTHHGQEMNLNNSTQRASADTTIIEGESASGTNSLRRGPWEPPRVTSPTSQNSTTRIVVTAGAGPSTSLPGAVGIGLNISDRPRSGSEVPGTEGFGYNPHAGGTYDDGAAKTPIALDSQSNNICPDSIILDFNRVLSGTILCDRLRG